MTTECVIGLQWGDEAKGKLVDILTADKDIVVRYQGGSNAGHTVVVGDQTYKLHHIPSGILNDGVTNVVGAGVVINPGTILKEIEGLKQRSLPIDGRLLLSDRAHVVFPWHVEEDRIWNQSSGGEESIGTTLRGIGPCYRDKVGRQYAIRLGDLIRDDLANRIERVIEHKRKVLCAMGTDSQHDALNANKIFQEYAAFGKSLQPMICDTTSFLLDAVDQQRDILFEGAQGALLDIDHGTFPYVTSSNSSGVGVASGSGVPAQWITKVIGVCKCYSTRVGGGPFPTELHDDIGETIRVTGKEFGTTTGRPRRCGWFDSVAVRYTARLSGVNFLSVMMLDVLSAVPEIKICTSYTLDGQTVDSFPSHVDDLRRIEPVYETMPGWNVDITGARTMSDLPENALNYVQRISELVGRPVEFISVGPDRAQTIQCDLMHSMA